MLLHSFLRIPFLELALVNFTIDRAAVQQLGVTAKAHHMAVVQHDDLVCVLQTGGTLADDEDGQSARQRGQRLAQGRVGGVVQCTGAVVEDEDVGPAHEGAGDGQALLLAAGEVSSPLLHRLIEAEGLGPDELRSLRRLQRGPEVSLGGVLVAPEQVRADGAAEELGLLHDHGHPAPQVGPGVLPDGTAHDLHAAFGGVVEAGDEADEAGFAAAGAADDADGLAAFGREADVGEAGCACALIGQAHMVEADGVAGLFRRDFTGRLPRELHARLGVQHRLHTACTGQRLAHLHDEVGQLD